jgi:hypothetical protein
MDDQMDDQINFDKAFSDMAEQVAVMNRECNRLQAALDRAEAERVSAVDATLDAAHKYLVSVYGHSPLAHQIDRARISAILTGAKP